MREKTIENPKLLVEVENIRSKRSVLRFISGKADGIFRRYPRLEGIRMNVKRETAGSRNSEFVAQTRLVLPGYDRIIRKRSAEIFDAIAQVFEVADRQLRKRARLFKVKQRV